MNIDDYEETEVDCEFGLLKLSAWAKDRAGNPAFLSINTDIDSGHASLTLSQAKVLAEKLTALVRGMEDAERH